MFFDKYKQQAVADRMKIESLEFQIEQLNEQLKKAQSKIPSSVDELQRINTRLESSQKDLSNIIKEIDTKTKEIEQLNERLINVQDAIYYQNIALYEPQFSLGTTQSYKQAIKDNLKAQKLLFKSHQAIRMPNDYIFSVNDQNTKTSKKFLQYIINNIYTSFNATCNKIISNINYLNLKQSERNIRAWVIDSNNQSRIIGITISDEIVDLKIQQLRLAYELAIKKQQDKEEKQHQAEILREQQLVQKELEEARKKLEKEQKHYEQQFEKATEEQKESIKEKMDEIQRQIDDNDYRYAHQKAGYLYVISNDDMLPNTYKLGVTRRLNPADRVDELGNASHAYKFKTHAMIFNEDVFALETAIHQRFDKQRVNMINKHKEFFNVTLDDIEQVLNKEFNIDIVLDRNVINEDYQLSIERADLDE